MYEAQCPGRLLEIWHKLFSKCSSSAAIGPAKKIIDCLRRIFHDKVGPLILELTKVVDWQNIAVLQVGNAPRFVKKVAKSFLVKLVDTQHLECQDTT